MRLKKSKVVFDEKQHKYTLKGVEKSGITSLIHSVLQLGNYSELSDYAKQVYLPIAARYGSSVHKTIQVYEESGVKSTYYGEETLETQDYGEQPMQSLDVSNELDSYISHKPQNCDVVASEFLVDCGSFASSIDAVWHVNGQIWLVDFKTTNLKSYHGGKTGLMEYLSWQLSCYAYMFEKQTGKKVDKLCGMWLRGEESEMWDIERKDNEEIKCLIEETEVIRIGSTVLYKNDKMQRDETPEVANERQLAVPEAVTKTINELLILEKAAKMMKDRLRELMEENNIKKWECEYFTATIAADSTVDKFDSKKFKTEHPDLYKEYTTQSIRKGGFIVKSK